MKSFPLTLLLLAGAYMQLSAQCGPGLDHATCRDSLHPYRFSGSAETMLAFGPESSIREIEFTAYDGQSYRLIFCPSGNFSEEVKIIVYDANRKNGGRNKVFETSTGSGSAFWIFEPGRTGNYYIEYIIPGSASIENQTGCITLLIGYRHKDGKGN